MKATCFADEDTRVIRLADRLIVREVSQDWGTHIGYAADRGVVEAAIAAGCRARRATVTQAAA